MTNSSKIAKRDEGFYLGRAGLVMGTGRRAGGTGYP